MDVAKDKVFNAGIYIRANVVNNNRDLQAEAISYQKDFLVDFIHKNGWNLTESYCDNGYSGINFNRPDFKRMIKDIKSHKINLVVTIDLSRLGRNFIDIIYYIGKFFSENHIRFIAVKDEIDTFDKSKRNIFYIPSLTKL
jgi:Site-specific recombinases, DNA invertase Pin homologs